MMLTGSRIQQHAELARKSSYFLDQLIASQSVQLYDQLYDGENETITVGYYTLVGINYDLDNVVPFPVITGLLGASDQEVIDFLRTKPISVGDKGLRSCAAGLHRHEQFVFVVHSPRCTAMSGETWGEGDQQGNGYWCVEMTRCGGCQSEWPSTDSHGPVLGVIHAEVVEYRGDIVSEAM